MTSSREAGGSLALLLLVAFTCVPSLASTPFVLKAQAISGALGAGISWHDDWYPGISGRLLNLGLAAKPWPEFGLGVEGTLINGPGQHDMDSYTPSAGIFVLHNASLKRKPHSTVAFACIDIFPRIGIGIGANWTFWAMNLEAELSWSRVYDNYVALSFRVGLGGWYQFGERGEPDDTPEWSPRPGAE